MNRASVGKIESRDRWLVLFDRKLAILHLVIDLFGYHRKHFVHWRRLIGGKEREMAIRG